MLNGRSVALQFRRWFRWRTGRFGFYTTRYVTACHEPDAETKAILLARAELAEKQLEAFDADGIVMQMEEIAEIDEGDPEHSPFGFTFYPDDRKTR
jgi:hypothetical protein